MNHINSMKWCPGFTNRYPRGFPVLWDTGSLETIVSTDDFVDFVACGCGCASTATVIGITLWLGVSYLVFLVSASYANYKQTNSWNLRLFLGFAIYNFPPILQMLTDLALIMGGPLLAFELYGAEFYFVLILFYFLPVVDYMQYLHGSQALTRFYRQPLPATYQESGYAKKMATIFFYTVIWFNNLVRLILIFTFGYFLWSTKLFCIRPINRMWLFLWTGQRSEESEGAKEEKTIFDGRMLNRMHLSQLFLNVIPMLILQCINIDPLNVLQYWIAAPPTNDDDSFVTSFNLFVTNTPAMTAYYRFAVFSLICTCAHLAMLLYRIVRFALYEGLPLMSAPHFFTVYESSAIVTDDSAPKVGMSPPVTEFSAASIPAMSFSHSSGSYAVDIRDASPDHIPPASLSLHRKSTSLEPVRESTSNPMSALVAAAAGGGLGAPRGGDASLRLQSAEEQVSRAEESVALLRTELSETLTSTQLSTAQLRKQLAEDESELARIWSRLEQLLC